MAITISEEELLGMPPPLLSELQAYLRECRTGSANLSDAVKPPPALVRSGTWEVPAANLVLSNVGDSNDSHIGVLVEQDDRSYIARKWYLTDAVKEIIKLAIDRGLDRLWRHRHPRDEYFTGGVKERVGAPHIGFSRDHHERWVFVLGPEARPPKTNVITFHKKYDSQLLKIFGPETISHEKSLNPGTWARETRGGRNLLVHPVDLHNVLKQISPLG